MTWDTTEVRNLLVFSNLLISSDKPVRILLNPIPEYHQFYYDSKWIPNNRCTKRIAVRKIETFPMSVDSFVIIRFDVPNQQRFIKIISFRLIGNESITYFLISLWE
ncbi:MAG: hypothetical protein Ta2E_10680 [Mycoplasmoidaceae bacterium]|nr:MAG: hypothetical protein Ta2E_10680 [Mycoplasmoidaceae bacterium]